MVPHCPGQLKSHRPELYISRMRQASERRVYQSAEGLGRQTRSILRPSELQKERVGC